MTQIHRVRAICFLVLLVCSFPREVLCDDGSLTLVPAEAELLPSGPTAVMVLLNNSSKDVWTSLKLSWISDTDLIVNVAEPAVARLEPGSQYAWRMNVSARRPDVRTIPLHVRVDFRFGMQRRIFLHKISLKPFQPQTVSALVDLAVKTSLVSLSEQRPGEVHVLLTNKTALPIELRGLTVKCPSFIECYPDTAIRTLLAGETYAVTMPVRVTDRVQPGKHLLLFKAALQWQQAAALRTGTLYQTHEVDVGVLGESDILKLLGVPSFLILPGVLLIITISLFWRFGKTAEEAAKFPLKVGSPEFWVVAISYSILAALLYPRLGLSRMYLNEYGLRDVIDVWKWSIIIGGGGFFLGKIGRKYFRLLRAKWEERMRPSEDDSPIQILAKLHRLNLPLFVDEIEVTEGTDKFIAYLIQPWSEKEDAHWLSPPIVLDVRATTPKEFSDRIYGELKETGNPKILADLLEEGERKKWLTAKWGVVKVNDAPKLDCPKLVEKDKTRRVDRKRGIVTLV